MEFNEKCTVKNSNCRRRKFLGGQGGVTPLWFEKFTPPPSGKEATHPSRIFDLVLLWILCVFCRRGWYSSMPGKLGKCAGRRRQPSTSYQQGTWRVVWFHSEPGHFKRIWTSLGHPQHNPNRSMLSHAARCHVLRCKEPCQRGNISVPPLVGPRDINFKFYHWALTFCQPSFKHFHPEE